MINGAGACLYFLVCGCVNPGEFRGQEALLGAPDSVRVHQWLPGPCGRTEELSFPAAFFHGKLAEKDVLVWVGRLVFAQTENV